MKKNYLLAVAVATALGSCSSDELVNESAASKSDKAPIGFSVEKQNITRATNLETVNHFNFGAWAWKVKGKNGLNDAEVMNNYLVGYSDETNKKGYDHTGATTWDQSAGDATDHKSPWFYEGLGNTQYKYTGTEGYYTTTDVNYLSSKDTQILRYWDLAYEKTNFYCYAPYNKNVTFEHAAGNSTMTFGDNNTIRDGYDKPLNTSYNGYDRSLSEYMYAGVQATNANLSDVTVPFKHMGAQLFIRFYEDIKDYKVEIIELNGDYGKLATGIENNYTSKGIQLAPAEKDGDNYKKAEYYTTQGATVTFNESDAAATYTAKWGNSTKTGTPLMFLIPTEANSTEATPANLTDYNGLGTTIHKIIPEKTASGVDQKFSYSPTIYYPVAQPTDSKTGFTIHVSYRIIAEDNKEAVTVHNAEVFVPASGKLQATDANDTQIAAWQPNKKYTYTFMITKNTTGTTNPDETIDPTDPTPNTDKALYPIVFDQATIDDYEEVKPTIAISE